MYTVSGVLASPVDQRDYIYVPRTRSFPASFSRRQYVVEYEDQDDQGACVGNGLGSTLETHAAHFGTVLDLSRQFIYNAGRHLEGRLGEEGMYVRSAYKILQRHGVPLEADYAYGVERNANPAPAIYDLAAARKISRYEFLYNRDTTYGSFSTAQRVDRIKAALLEGLIPSIALQVTDSIRYLRGPWRSHNYDVSNGTNTLIGGHLMYVIGWDDSVGMFEVVNSWGESWGDFGIGGFPYSIVDEMFFESWVARDFASMAVPEAPGIKLEYQNQFSVGFRIVPEATDLGRTVNIWIGAKLPDGRIFLRNSSGDTWQAATPGVFPPAFQHTLTEDNPLKAVNWMWNLADFAGARLHAAYGGTPMDWTLAELCTIPLYR